MKLAVQLWTGNPLGKNRACSLHVGTFCTAVPLCNMILDTKRYHQMTWPLRIEVVLEHGSITR